MRRRALAAGLAAVCCVATGACTASTGDGRSGISGMHGSRNKTYASVDQLTQDSTAVLRVRILDRRTTGSVDDPLDVTTVSRGHVLDVAESPKIGLALGNDRAAGVKPGATVFVRQFGSPEMIEVPAPLLEPGRDYILFLRPTELGGKSRGEFYVTGGVAGIFRQDPGSARSAVPTYVRAEPSSGDNLPASISIDDVEAK